MNLQVDVQSASGEAVPDEVDIRRWIAAALAAGNGPHTAEVCVRLVDRDEMATLNATYRGKPGPTNVLSFPAGLPAELELPLLGDIVICAPVVAAEAADQGKDARAHWAHMAVHGALHLLGYDHIDATGAAAMETLETAVLADLGFDCPYDIRAREGVTL